MVFSVDHVSSIDDVAFDLYQEPEVAKIIRQLDKKKQSVIQGHRIFKIRFKLSGFPSSLLLSWD